MVFMCSQLHQKRNALHFSLSKVKLGWQMMLSSDRLTRESKSHIAESRDYFLLQTVIRLFHHAFMNFWEPRDEQWGLTTVLTELKGYRQILALSDILYIGKNLQTRFLKHLLTFSHGTFSKSSDRNKMC
jgi:hypothetical protein